MNNNMYLYFDSNGYLKEFITCPARAGSENVNSIYFYVEPALESDRNKVDSNGDAYYALPNNLDHGVLTFKLHDVLDGVTDENGVALNSLAFTSANFRIEDIQPFNKKRDLLFFKWFQKYQFVKVDLTTDILLTPGNVECTIGCYNVLNTKVYNLDLFSFYVADSAVQSANYVTTSQYHMLLALMKSGLSSAVSRYDIDALDTLADIYDLIGTQISVLNIDDKEYLVEMNNSGSIVLYDLYNREWYAYEGSDTTAIDDVTRYLYRYHIATKEDLENFGNLFTYKGAASVSEINALTNIGNGWCYNLTDSGTLTLGNLSVETGDNVAFDGTAWTKLSSETVLGNYYTKQEGQAFETRIDNRVTSVENELSSVASGSPKGVYATLAALQAAYPTGTTGIYVVSADGHWYYWNGSAWTDGGAYLSSGEDVEKLQNKMDFVLTDHSFFYNENITVEGTGAWANESYYFSVNFEETTKVTLKVDNVVGYTANDCLYMYALDENDQVLAQIAIFMTGEKTVSINCPTTTKRIRVQFYPAGATPMPTGSATYYGVLCYWGDIPRYIETSKLNPDLQKSVDDLTESFNEIVTDNAFIYKEDLVVSGTSTYVSKNYDFEVNFETQTKVTLHIDNIVGNTAVDCAYLYALDENDASISYIAIYWGTRDTVSLDCPTTTKKIRVQLYPASGTAMPTGSATFYGVTCYYGEKAKYIDASKVYPNTLHVGTGYKYATIQSAVDDAEDGDTILIHDGTYDESVKVYGETQNIHTSAKNLRLVGTNRDSCILTHSISDYANPPLEIAMGYVENLTIICTGDTTSSQFAYCVHMDFGTSMYKNVQFNNCRFVNTKYPCVGTGIREGQKEYFLNCVFECDDAASFLFHEDQTNNVTNNSITFDGCTFVSNSSYDATIHVQETSALTGNYLSVTFRRNIVKHTNNGQLVRLYELNNGEINGNGWLNSNTYHLTVDSDLNSNEVFDFSFDDLPGSSAESRYRASINLEVDNVSQFGLIFDFFEWDLDNSIDELNAGLSQMGVSTTITKENWSTVIPTLLNQMIQLGSAGQTALVQSLGLLLQNCYKCISGTMDGYTTDINILSGSGLAISGTSILFGTNTVSFTSSTLVKISQ